MILETLIISLTLLLALAGFSVLYLVHKIKKQKIILKKVEERSNFAHSNPNPVMCIDKQGICIFANLGSESILSEWATNLNEKIPEEWSEVINEIILSDQAQTIEIQSRDKAYLFSIVPIKGEQARMYGMNVTSLKNLEKELFKKSTSDEETKLPNIVMFKKCLSEEALNAKKSKLSLALIVVKFNDYSQIVYTYGQENANLILVELSLRIKKITRIETMIARLSDNEFGVIVTNTSGTYEIASYLEELSEKTTEIYSISGNNVFISVSIGITFSTDIDTPDSLSRNARLALNRSNSTNKPYAFFQRGMEEDVVVKRETIAELYSALKNNEFQLAYQPQIDLNSKQLIGCEALIRWNHPTKGFVSPFFFIPVAEESKLIIEIGHWVLINACKQIREWIDQGLSPIQVSVNLSARQILEVDIIAIMKELMTVNSITGDWLSIELTEGAIVSNKDEAIEVMKELKKLGLMISIDDFGTGYSSLSYLSQFPVDKLKIDRSFVIEIKDESEGHAVTKGIIELGHNMKMKVVAEGVENNLQLQYLVHYGCDIIQGYIFGKPEPAETFIHFFNTDWNAIISKLTNSFKENEV